MSTNLIRSSSNCFDELAGISFPDPYRRLEERSPSVLEWQTSQASAATAHVRSWPHFTSLRDEVVRFSTEQYWRSMIPRFVAGRWFRTRSPTVGSKAQVIVSDEPMGHGRVLFDTAEFDRRRPPSVTWLSPSPDGSVLALGVCDDGGETSRIVLLCVETGTLLPNAPEQVLMDNSVAWLPDSSGFMFCALDGAATDFSQVGYLHRREQKPTTTTMSIPWTRDRDWRWIVVSPGGRYAIAFEGIMSGLPVAIADLTADPLHWRPFVTSIEGRFAGHIVGDCYIAATDVGAPRGRVVSVRLDATAPNDPDSWQELVPESLDTIRTVTAVGKAIYISGFSNTYASVRAINYATGEDLGAVPLPGRGALGAEWWGPWQSTLPKGHPDEFIFTFSTLTCSPGLYRHRPGSLSVETLYQPEVEIPDAIIEDHWATSLDGTKIPYHLVRRADVCGASPQPTLIHAYGGFNGPLVPQFPGAAAAFVVAGGVFIHAHIRGGGEFGADWWTQGRLRNKQNGYNDLYAVAEHLITEGRATANTLAVVGESNGGLMAGVALTQRPDLWAVAIPLLPILDLIGACREPYGRMVVAMEFADIDDPEDVRRLATFSPYHLVDENLAYPAVYIQAGDTDPRCPAWHARKFAARLQAAVAGESPVYLHVWPNAGHGGVIDRALAVEQSAEWLAFVLMHLGVDTWR
jgi:prolyl oligopeptidase